MARLLRKLIHEDDGPTAVEYAVMLALIVVIAIGSIRLAGQAVSASFTDSQTQINDAMSGS